MAVLLIGPYGIPKQKPHNLSLAPFTHNPLYISHLLHMNPTGASVLWPGRNNVTIHSYERWRPCSFVIKFSFTPCVQHGHSVQLNRLCFLKFLKDGHSSIDWCCCHDWSLIISVPSFIGSLPSFTINHRYHTRRYTKLHQYIIVMFYLILLSLALWTCILLLQANQSLPCCIQFGYE
jgi:hypothetical protein